MSPILSFLAPLALAAVALALFLGLFNLARGGSPQRSQVLMRWRIGLQLVAIVVVMATLYFGTR
jgi:hypothetical protein